MGARTSQEVCDGPQGMAEVKGMLRVACTRSSELIGIAADVLTMVERIEVAGNPDALGSAPTGPLSSHCRKVRR